MKVVLKADVKGTGKKGTVVNVSDGFARNFLFPKGLGVEATSNELNMIEQHKASENYKKEVELAAAKELGNKINETVLNIKTKCGANGKLFGAITSKDIAETLNKQLKLSIDKKKFELDSTIKVLGSYTIPVKLHHEVTAKLKVNITEEK